MMPTQVYVNLPVKNLKKSRDFFSRLGFRFNPLFSDDGGACMIVSDTIFVMLLVESRFKTFTPKAICDATRSTEVLLCLSVESRARVDDMVCTAAGAGGSIHKEPQDHGFMYGHGFQDLDGHIWELVYMNPTARHP
jgi:uncharacterized protein